MNHTPEQHPYNEHQPYPVEPLLNAWYATHHASNTAPQLLRIDALAIADPQMGLIPKATLILRHTQTKITIEFAAPTRELPGVFTQQGIPQFTLHDQLIMPALVNAHTHLDLSHIGPQHHEPGDGFVQWVDMIRASRASDDTQIARCVRLGIEKSLAGGVIAVGDIAGAPAGRFTQAPARALASSPLIGVSYLEFFGIGTTAASTTRRLDEFLRHQLPALRHELSNCGIALGLQPHAPNTVDLGVYRWATHAAKSRALPLCTHLAETIEERMFIQEGIGPQRAMLEGFGIWDDSVLQQIAHGKHPVEHLLPVLQLAPYLVAHVNDANDATIDLLAKTHTSVAYCPRASRYFGSEAQFGPHRYREMREAGINVCLGTDSIVNLDTPDRITTLDEMRLLYAQNAEVCELLLPMCTVNAASALGLDPKRFTIGTESSPIGLIGLTIDPSTEEDLWAAAMSQSNPPQWLFLE